MLQWPVRYCIPRWYYTHRRGPTCGGCQDTSQRHRRPCSSSREGCPWTTCCSRSGRACVGGWGRRTQDRPWRTGGSSVRLRSCTELSCVGTREADLPVIQIIETLNVITNSTNGICFHLEDFVVAVVLLSFKFSVKSIVYSYVQMRYRKNVILVILVESLQIYQNTA